MAPAVEIDHVSKNFRLFREKYTSLKERLIHLGRVPYQDFMALDDVSLSIQAGQTVGLLGHNGSGKSTLLKCVAGILQPSTGSVTTVGRLAALLELGAGFHPDLSGRENVYLNASILGMKKADVDKVFDDIVDFAGLEQFIDTPVRHYSSGMYIRLGFSVAINVDPEILLVDEVLAVGDESFQRKCIDKVKTFQSEGRTIIMVTHAVEHVRQLCDQAAALDHGKLVIVGDPNEVIREFRERLMSGVSSAAGIDPNIARSELSPLWGKVRIAEVEILYPDPERHNVARNETLCFDVHLESTERVEDVVIGIAVYGPMGQLVHGTNSSLRGATVGPLDGKTRVRFRVKDVPLLDGTYPLTVGVHTLGGLVYDHWEQLRRFEVASGGSEEGLVALPVEVEVER